MVGLSSLSTFSLEFSSQKQGWLKLHFFLLLMYSTWVLFMMGGWRTFASRVQKNFNLILVNLVTTNDSSHFNQRSRYSNSIMNWPCRHEGNQNAFQYLTRSHEFFGYRRQNFHGNFSQSGRGQHDKSSYEGNNKSQCQLCGRKGHVVIQWYYQFD